MLVRASQKRHESHVNVQAVFGPDFDTDLTNRLDERLRLDIADRAADFGDDDVGVDFFADVINKLFYFVRDVRNNLYGRAEIFAPSFFVEDVPENLARREI